MLLKPPTHFEGYFTLGNLVYNVDIILVVITFFHAILSWLVRSKIDRSFYSYSLFIKNIDKWSKILEKRTTGIVGNKLKQL